MSGKGIVFTGFAIFFGVFGALQADRFLSRRALEQHVNLMPGPSNDVIPASLDTTQDGSLDFRAAAKKVIPSVVSVDRYEQASTWFGEPLNQITETGTGSGVIVGADGLIVTNNHVVADQNGQPAAQVKVRLNDKRTFTAKVIGTDPLSDIAVLKISGSNLEAVEIGSSSSLQVGQWVMAVGNPLGFDDTVSVGVVSSLKRDLPVGPVGIVNAIQTDAAINPGNSGGALTDQHGKLVGINSAIASGNGGSVGIGFAIPVDRVQAVVNDIVKLGYARHASLGISYSRQNEGILVYDQARADIAQQTGSDPDSVPTNGIVVLGSAGATAKAGIGRLDIIMSVDGVESDSIFNLNRVLLLKKPGDQVQVKWWSHGQTKSAQITLQESGGPTR